MVDLVDISQPGWGAQLERYLAEGTLTMSQASALFAPSPKKPKLEKQAEDSEEDSKDAITFARRVGGLKRLPRTGWIKPVGGLTPRVESVAEHSFRVGVLALLLPSLDAEAVAMGLLHDLAETIVGDITPAQNVSDDAKVLF
jgi:putative hydrolase of HD superfamily